MPEYLSSHYERLCLADKMTAADEVHLKTLMMLGQICSQQRRIVGSAALMSSIYHSSAKLYNLLPGASLWNL